LKTVFLQSISINFDLFCICASLSEKFFPDYEHSISMIASFLKRPSVNTSKKTKLKSTNRSARSTLQLYMVSNFVFAKKSNLI